MKVTTMYIVLVWIHFIADFVCQSDEMAINKSKSVLWLGIHSLVYTSIFMIIVPFTGITFILFNGISHFFIDMITSKITSYFGKKKKDIGSLLQLDLTKQYI